MNNLRIHYSENKSRKSKTPSSRRRSAILGPAEERGRERLPGLISRMLSTHSSDATCECPYSTASQRSSFARYRRFSRPETVCPCSRRKRLPCHSMTCFSGASEKGSQFPRTETNPQLSARKLGRVVCAVAQMPERVRLTDPGAEKREIAETPVRIRYDRDFRHPMPPGASKARASCG